ncbi:hypothetical protein PR048_023018 [Dryococelus australis]|uniref:Reverse transcriptase domain-containing protein n=1 Tax=Dryococelus australis TaxID=614101 RepID=A0ABQ9GSW8_9NEOP|nr:hypothetical protein PR048_023018 [Dryococelus australis]
MRVEFPTLLRGAAPATRTWAQTLAAGQHTVTSAGKTDPTDTTTPPPPPRGESFRSVLKSSVQTPMQDDTVDGSEKLLSLPIHASPGTSIVSQISLLEYVPNGTGHFMARQVYLIDADDTLEDDDMAGEKKPRHKSRSPRRDVVVPESPQSQRRAISGTLLKPPTPPSTEPVQLALCVNVYSPSGTPHKTARTEFFRTEILPFPEGDRTNIIFGGDLNSVLNPLDRRGGLYPTNTALQELVTAIQVEDVVDILNIQRPHHTFHAHSSRTSLHRFYVSRNNRQSVRNYGDIPAAFVDHCLVLCTIDCLLRTPVHGRNYWRLQTRLVGQDEVDSDFRQRWLYWVRQKPRYADATDWWERCVKPGVRRLFQFHGARCRHEQASVLYFYERALRDLDTAASTGTNVRDTARPCERTENVCQTTIDNAAGATFVRSTTNRPSEDSSDLLQCQITDEEVALMVQHTPKKKSPGIDGIPHITLLCTDYKILARLFANRLNHVLSDIVGPEQCCAVRNTSVIRGVAVLRDVQLIVKSTPGPVSLLDIGLDKAFDLVNWNLLDRIMLHKVLPFNPPYAEGVPYPCLNSYCTLNPSYEHCTRNSTVSVLGHELLTCIGFSDDVTCIVRSEDDVALINDTLSAFTRAATPQVTSAKTTLPDQKPGPHALRQVSPYVKTDKLRTLGTEFMQNSEQMIKYNWDSVVH